MTDTDFALVFRETCMFNILSFLLFYDRSVAKGNIVWDKNPTKLTTPYGGRLVWTMPGGTQLNFHLKDKNKIRHRKRWSQVGKMLPA